ncbi:hypothetical protein Cgig2_031975 [Carnegiea gigantea]|uniref:Peptidase M14 domain-containing protein n=1 Tax=Carnegiea gigantea TaxID=171969 RepID=A0A9Q1K6P8_9CARY|nr:hypothetical protein Cgig2_031975 [Carnegiea gigantea]
MQMDSLSSCWIFLAFLACLPCLSPVDARNPPNSSITPINRDLYHSSADLMEEIEALVHRHPNKFTMETFEGENKGYLAHVAVVTYCRNRQENDKSKFRVLLSFGQHGRELITTELAFRILSILSEEEFLPNMDRLSLNATLDRLIIKDYDPYEESPGRSAFSEPESQIMRKLVLSFQPHLWVNVHSGMEALFMPYDHKNSTPDGELSMRMKALITQLNNLHFQGRCMTGSGGGSVGYLAHGTATDYIYEVAKVPLVFTFEIYGDESAAQKDCFKMFNPTDLTTFNRVLNDWSAAFFTIFKLGPWQLVKANSGKDPTSVKWISIDDYLDGYLMGRRSRYGKKMEVFDLGLQEIRSYFRLFMLSCVILMFMFCTRISKSKLQRPLVPTMPS